MQNGQVFELRTTGPGGRRLWAYRYRLDGRGSRRIQRGGYVTADDARAALQQALTAAQHRQGCVRIMLADLAEEYLAQHDCQPATTAKLRWLLTTSTAAFGSTPIGELDAREIAAWRMTLPAGHRFEATQALRQTLARAVEWGTDRHQPRQDRRRQPAAAAPRDAPLRHASRARSPRRRARTPLRTDGPVRRRHRPAPG
jgi:hypothetical protein